MTRRTQRSNIGYQGKWLIALEWKVRPIMRARTNSKIRFGNVPLALVALLLGGPALAVPPFSGTIFLDPDIITENDPTAFVDITARGQGMRSMFDRRVNSFILVNAFLFDATYDDGLQIETKVQMGLVQTLWIRMMTRPLRVRDEVAILRSTFSLVS